MTISWSLPLLLISLSDGTGNTKAHRLQGNRPAGNGNGPPEFLRNNQLPAGLVNNPSTAVGVKFKAGKKPKVQKLMKADPKEGHSDSG